ncbi:MAG: diaminopimelate epimerase [Candidatus Eisenbacteria bacterium]|nr:diaminopimelate epimerase [Candidatus Eisenbacteria bacterium]
MQTKRKRCNKSPRTRDGRRRRDGAIHFYKVSGAGNHFVLLDVREKRLPMPKRALVKALCLQGHSVGADGVLFIERSSAAEFRLRYHNADGGEAPMCGNGARCAAAYAFQNGARGAKVVFETPRGLIEAMATRGGVELNMGPPRGLKEGLVVRTSTGRFEGSFLNTGVPHFVTVVEDLQEFDVQSSGRELRFHKSFGRGGANVDFVEIDRRGSVLLRTYERGVEAETLACGTGAIAAAVCLAAKGLVKPPVKVLTWGGDMLVVRFAERSNPLSAALLEGPAQVVYEGEIALSVLRSVAGRF